MHNYFSVSTPIACITSKPVAKATNFVYKLYYPKRLTIDNIQCPICGNKEIIRKGKRKLKHGEAQIYRCRSCNKAFSDKDIKYKSYPAKIILNSISTYNLGYTLEQTRKEIAKRFKIRIPESTVHSWVKEYSSICTFSKLRSQAIKLFCPKDIVFSHKLQHNQVYNFQLHKAKLSLLTKELPEDKFSKLKSYLERIPTNDFPHHIFKHTVDSSLNQRASQVKFNTLNFIKTTKQNLANTLASLGLQLAKANKERHRAIQNFMLINDSVTIATEVPVYLTEDDISYY